MIKTRYTSIGSEYFDVTEKILRLSDELSEEIVLENIRETLEDKTNPFRNSINYLMLYIDRFNRITGQEDYYDKEFMEYSSTRVCQLILDQLKESFGIELGNDLDFYTLSDYLNDTDTLYEFIFLRQYKNITDYIIYMIEEHREQFLTTYKYLLGTETHSRDVFVQLALKKFKNEDDVAIVHFIGDIINDIRSMYESAYNLFETIIKIDPQEEYNSRFSYLLGRYGEAINFDGDSVTYSLYMNILDDPQVFNDVRNAVLMNYLTDVEIEDDGRKIEDTLDVEEDDL